MALRSNRVIGQSCSEGGWLADLGPLEGQQGHWWGGRLGLLVQAHSEVWHKADSWTAGESKTMQSGWDRYGNSFTSSHDRMKNLPDSESTPTLRKNPAEEDTLEFTRFTSKDV